MTWFKVCPGAGCAALTADGSVDRRGGNQYRNTCFLVGADIGYPSGTGQAWSRVKFTVGLSD
jgi:hypothetical protein